MISCSFFPLYLQIETVLTHIYFSLSLHVAELGDYNETEHSQGYLSDFCFIPNPPQDFHKEVAKHHQQHR